MENNKNHEDDIMVSVCMITYNHEKYISQALDSILCQKTNFKYEIVIGDDCSQDKTVSIINEYVKKYPDKIVLVARKENMGMTRNSYNIRCRAKGRYIAFLEGDDYWLDEHKLQKQFDFLETNENCSAICGRVLTVNESGHPLGKTIPMGIAFDQCYGKREAEKYQVSLLHSASLMYRNFIKNNNDKYSFLAQNKRNMGGHRLTVFLLASLGDIYVSSDIFAAYRQVKRLNGSSASSLMIQEKVSWERGRLEVFFVLKEHLGSEYDFTPFIINAFVELREFLNLNQVPSRRKILREYFTQLTQKEKRGVIFKLFKEMYI